MSVIDLPKLLDLTYDCATESLLRGTRMPMIVGVAPNDLVILPAQYENDEEKALFVRAVREAFRAHGVFAYVVSAEAWMVVNRQPDTFSREEFEAQLDREWTDETRPANRSDRIETLLMMGITKSEHLSRAYEIIRDDNGNPRELKAVTAFADAPLMVGGAFAELLNP